MSAKTRRSAHLHPIDLHDRPTHGTAHPAPCYPAPCTLFPIPIPYSLIAIRPCASPRRLSSSSASSPSASRCTPTRPTGRARGDGHPLRRDVLARRVGVDARRGRQLPRHGARGPAPGPRPRRLHHDRHVGGRRLRERHRRADLQRRAAASAGAVGLRAQPDRRRALVRARDAPPRLHDAAGSVRAALRQEVRGAAVSARAHRRGVLDRRDPHRARHDVRPDPRRRYVVVDRALGGGGDRLHRAPADSGPSPSPTWRSSSSC